MSFVPLHVHSEYSLSDSILRIDDIIKYAQRAQLESVALTDKNNIFGLIKFYKKARAAGIKPILGCDMSVRHADGTLSQLVLLVQNALGFQSLCALLSAAYAIDQTAEAVAVHHSRLNAAQCSGLIALSGGMDGDIAQAVVCGDIEKAFAHARHWQNIFGDRYYLQLSRQDIAKEEDYYAACYDISKQLGIAAVATNLACFLSSDDYDVHETRVCISGGWVIEDTQRPRRFTPAHYLRTPEEMDALFQDAPALVENSAIIAQRCNVELTLGKSFLPVFSAPADQSVDIYLSTLVRDGLEHKLPLLYPDQVMCVEKTPIYKARLETEIQVITQMGFAGYFLIVADFIKWAKAHEIPVGPGRGSGAGSLVAYVLGITDVDPLAYDLLFERFLNPERISMPDFDIDFCMEKRDNVIQYVAEKYGHDKVAQIATHGTMAAKAVVRDVGRVLGMPYPVCDRISKLIPRTLGVTLSDAIGRTSKARENPEFFSSELLYEYEHDDDVHTLIDIALQLEGLARNVGKHAGGVVIAPTQLTNFSALYCERAGAPLSTQFDKDDIEAVGLVKFDFLGLRTLTVIDWAIKNVNQNRTRHGMPVLRIETLSFEDKKTFDLLKSGRTSAVFQLESTGIKGLIRKLQPDTFEDIIALVALYRPGPLQSGMVDDFINRKQGRAQVAYPHPALEPILKTTYGVIVYQEQVMQVAQTLANYTLGEADILRRAMGKKKPEEMIKQKEIFITRAVANGVNNRRATEIFDLMEKFAEYGFNKSHSVAYAVLSYQTAWLKAHYPAEFMAAVFTSDMDKTEKLVPMIEESLDMGLVVKLPCINQSRYEFSVDDDGAILFGLGAIKGIGEGAISELIKERDKRGAFSSLLDLCQRIDLKKLNRKTLETLIYAGAFDKLNSNRASLHAMLEKTLSIAEQYHHNRQTQQRDMFGFESREGDKSDILLSTESDWDSRTRLTYEKTALGMFLSDHPINAVSHWLQKICHCKLAELEVNLQTTPNARAQQNNREIVIGGLVVDVFTRTTKKGRLMAIVTLDDRSGRREITFFDDIYVKYREILKSDAIIVVTAQMNYAAYTKEWRCHACEAYLLEQAYYQLAKRMRITLDSTRVPTLISELSAVRSTADAHGVAVDLCIHCNDIALVGELQLPGYYQIDQQKGRHLMRMLGEDCITMLY